MNGFLLDSHVLLWWLTGSPRLAPRANTTISDGSNPIWFSAGAAWELSIKKTLGRIDFPSNLPEVLEAERIRLLPITLPHALAVATLPLHHQDPFDRIQIAQAQVEGLTLITADSRLADYDVRVLTT